MNTLVEIKNLSKSIASTEILNNINFNISKAEFLTIIGPNGAGKSTLLKCIMGAEKPSSGKIITRQNVKIGYVPQQLDIDRTIPISVEFFLALNKNISKTELENIAQEVDIKSILDKSLSALSGGQLQRVLVARSLLGNPSILILDEPTKNLDVSGQLLFHRLVDSIFERRKIAIVMVSHDLNTALVQGELLLCLDKEIKCYGKTSEVTKMASFKKMFGTDMDSLIQIHERFCKSRHK